MRQENRKDAINTKQGIKCNELNFQFFMKVLNLNNMSTQISKYKERERKLY